MNSYQEQLTVAAEQAMATAAVIALVKERTGNIRGTIAIPLS